MNKKCLKKIIQQLLSTLYIFRKKTCPAYISKINTNSEKQIILLMTPTEEKENWYYLAAKKLSTLLRRTTSKHDGNFYCLNTLHYFTTENKIKSLEKVFQNKIFCGIVVPSEKGILQFNQYMKLKRHALLMLILNP